LFTGTRFAFQQRKVVERNREYNAFLENQKDKEQHRFDKSKGGGTSRRVRIINDGTSLPLQ
jgi:hypothetical protein